MSVINKNATEVQDRRIPFGWMIVLHLLPGVVVMLLMLMAGPLFQLTGLFPSLLIIFVLVGPLTMVGLLGFLYYKGKQMNGKLSLQRVVLYRQNPMPWWKIVLLALPLLAWIAIVWYIIKPPVNRYFVEHFFSWMPVYFFDEHFLNNLSQYTPNALRVIGILFTLSISFGGAVEELYFRGYLLPRMESLGSWAPIANIVLFSLYHFWSPWENLVRLLGLTPWILAVWRTRNIYLSLLVHFTINAFSGLSLLSLIWHLR